MRVGMNPARGKFSDYFPARVTVAVLVHIPHLTGYFERRLDVLRLCLASILENTDTPFDLLVFNNGSTLEVKEYLDQGLQSGSIQYLLHSERNVGKIGAFQILFRAAPGEVVAYTDDDIYFFPGWLKKHLEILDAFPKVGMVSGCAVRTLFNMERISTNLEFAATGSGVELETGKFIPGAWTEDWAESYGKDLDIVLAETEEVDERVLKYKGLRVFAMANHNQFITPKEVIISCLPRGWSGRLMGEMDDLDVAVNDAGYLRLSTIERTTQHLGNKIPETFLERVAIDLDGYLFYTADEPPRRSMGRVSKMILASRPVRWFLLGVYSRLFRWLNPE